MEYLPEKKRTQKMQVLKKEGKIRDFREYLADSEVVLAIVKCNFLFLIFKISSRLEALHLGLKTQLKP